MSERLASVGRHLIQALLALCAVLAGFPLTSTTALASPTYAYDVPPQERFHVHEFGADGSNPAHLVGAGEESVSPSADARGTSTTLVFTSVATNTADKFVDLTGANRSHILDGEVRPNGTYSGGHRPGTGYPGKSEFPAVWSDDQIIHNISDVATDPASLVTPKGGLTSLLAHVAGSILK